MSASNPPAGLWQSPLSAQQILSQPSPPAHPFRHDRELYWLQILAKQNARAAIVKSRPGQEPRCITPLPFNLRARNHEYGGKCFCVVNRRLVFFDLESSRVYAQSFAANAKPKPITPTPHQTQHLSYADLVGVARHNLVLAVREKTESGASQNCLVSIDLANQNPPQVLAQGSDFYACPVVSPHQDKVAWLEWDDPFMPWDQTRLVQGNLRVENGVAEIHARRVVVDCPEQAVCQIGFFDQHTLLYVSDSPTNDAWDFFAARGDSVTQITDDEYAYGEAHWQFGEKRWQVIADDAIIAVGSLPTGDVLRKIQIGKTPAQNPTRIAETYAKCGQLYADGDANELLFIAHHADRIAEIQYLSLDSVIASDGASATPQSLQGLPSLLTARDCSLPRALRYPTRDGSFAHAWFYPPHNRAFALRENEKPPLLVMVHGGPTSRATAELHPLKQFFASKGYAILDVNHRGSTGYGRAYRQHLLGKWGEVDATDIADGVAYVLANQLADPELVFIRGGSAGGYAVLRALTRFPELFCGGACYYGIGNLVTLAEITHKFEAHYTDRLLGEKFDRTATYDPVTAPDSRFITRSPIFQLDQLQSPLIVFQGSKDKVVPPQLAREVVTQLKRNGIPHEYVEYPDEGHGFRLLPNRVDSLQREVAFFAARISQTRTQTRAQTRASG